VFGRLQRGRTCFSSFKMASAVSRGMLCPSGETTGTALSDLAAIFASLKVPDPISTKIPGTSTVSLAEQRGSNQ